MFKNLKMKTALTSAIKNEVTDLRVVAGDFGGRPLKTLEGLMPHSRASVSMGKSSI